MAEKTKAAPIKSGEYVQAARIIEEADEQYENQGRSDLYSTGLSDLDEYLSGGFGRRNNYEIIMIASAPKSFKTTLALQLLAPQIENKTPMYWMLAEMSYGETLNGLRALYYPDKSRIDNAFCEAIESRSLLIADKQTMSSFRSYEDILAEIKVAYANGARLFYIDPINYLIKGSVSGFEKTYDAEFKFLNALQSFVSETKTTALLVLHNVKNPNMHRQEGLSGSASYAQMATKNIETRVEGRYTVSTSPFAPPVMGKIVSVELWQARGQESWAYQPMLLKAVPNDGGKGIKLAQLSTDDYKNVTVTGLSSSAPDHKDRSLWHIQETMFNGAGRDGSKGFYG